MAETLQQQKLTLRCAKVRTAERRLECSDHATGSIHRTCTRSAVDLSKALPSSSASSSPQNNGGEPATLDTEYICSEDLTPLQEDPEVVVNTLLERLDSKEWVSVCDALTHSRQLATFHAPFMIDILDSVVALTIKAMKNPRSALCKSAIMASTDFFKAYQDQLLEFLDPLILQLLLKASQDKRFVCEEAEKALVGMTTWLSPTSLLQKLQPYIGHRNPRVRAKASTCVRRSVSKLGVQGIKEFGLETLIRMGAAQLNDQLPEAREAARQLVMDIREAYDQQQCSASLSSPSSSSPSSLSSSSCSSLSSSSSDDPITLPSLETEQEKWEQFCRKQLPPRTALAVLRATCVAN